MFAKLPARSPAPAPRCSHTATRVEEGILVLGGGVSDGGWRHFGDAWLLDLSNMRWRALEVSGGFCPRRGHSTAYDAPRRRLVVFGGGRPRGNS